jgi:hypothetical protein
MLVVFAPHVSGQETYTVVVSVQGIPPNMTTNVYVDGGLNGTLAGGETRAYIFAISSATHIITVDFYVPNSTGVSGTRYYNNNTSWAFPSGDHQSHAFTYTPQYYLSVESAYSSADGQGWYDSGSVARAVLNESEVDEGQGVRHVFTGWSADASGSGSTSNDILMNGPKRAVAEWRTQFYLTIDTDPPSVGGPKGVGWYDAGSQANFSVSQIVPANQDSRLRFSYWTGEYASQLPTGNVTMDRPKSVKAHYVAQYLLTVEYDPASISSSYNETHTGWYDAGENVQLGPVPATLDLSSVERLKFVQWTDNGAPSTDVSTTVLMDKPHKVTLSYKTQYYVDVRSSYGTASGSGWYDRGDTVRVAATPTSGTWPISYTLSDWHVDPSTTHLAKTDDSWALTVDRPYTIEAVWSIDYFPLIGLIGAGALLAVIAAVVVLAYKRGMVRRGGPRIPVPTPIPSTATLPIGGPTKVCSNCGNRMPESAVFCQRCGAAQEGPALSTSDEKVYDYIVKHQGVISLSKASKDLGIAVEQLKEITEKLKKMGRLA